MSNSESGTSMEVLSLLMKQRKLYGIIALKGRPSTCKTELAQRIGGWANCPVLCIQDFLAGGGGLADHLEGAEADLSPPTSTDQVERRHRKAFTILLNVAGRLLSERVSNCVVIKSSFNTLYEIQQLMQLIRRVSSAWYNVRCTLTILECKIRNKYLWKLRFEQVPTQYERSKSSWSLPRSWKEIEMAVDDDDLPPSSDLSILQDIHYDVYIAWLQVDPIYDLFLSPKYTNEDPLGDEFNDAIKYLLTAPTYELLPQNPYVADYNELRQFLFDQKLRDAAQKGRSKSSCEGACVFRYWDQVPQEYEADFCGACQGEISRQPACTCHLCATTLHKTCSERFPINALQSSITDYLKYFYDHTLEQQPYKACQGGGKEFSKECGSYLTQDRLNCHLLPTIFYHKFHQHFLSIHLYKTYFRCMACGIDYDEYVMGCKRCAFYYHVHCAYLPLELKHDHGGHEHIMKLMYTRDSMEVEEDPCWCDCCYRDMDPEEWFYSCQVCPHYVVHLRCSSGFDLQLNDPKMLKFVDQLQSQLDDLRATGNPIKPC